MPDDDIEIVFNCDAKNDIARAKIHGIWDIKEIRKKMYLASINIFSSIKSNLLACVTIKAIGAERAITGSS